MRNLNLRFSAITENRMMIIAFLVGILLQVVTEIPILTEFGTMELSLTEWLKPVALSTAPLVP